MLDRLRNVLATISASLGKLTATQRALIFSLVVVAVLFLALVSQLSGRSSMVALMPGAPLTAQEQAAGYLESVGHTVRWNGGNLMVPTERKAAITAQLAEANRLPENTGVLFSTLHERVNWMNSKAENDRQYLLALRNELGLVIRRMKGIKGAEVFLSVPETTGLGAAARRPTASVQVSPSSAGALSQSAVDGIAALVAGSVPGMQMSDVSVVDSTTGRALRARGENDLRAGSYLEAVAKLEDYVRGKLEDHLRSIPGVIVTVTASADVRAVETRETRALPLNNGTVSVPSEETTETTSTQGGGGSGGEAGVRSNVQADVSAGAGGGGNATRSSTEKNESRSMVEIGRKTEHRIDPGGVPTRINATVNVPRAYIAALAKEAKGGDGKSDVTAADIEAAFTAERDRLLRDLQPLVETAVADPTAPGAGGAAAAGGTGGTAAPGIVQRPGTVVVSMITGVGGVATGVAQAGTLGLSGLGGGGGGGGESGRSARLGRGVVRPGARRWWGGGGGGGGRRRMTWWARPTRRRRR